MEQILYGADRENLTFQHGVHPEEFKAFTASLPIERMPFVDEYVLPLSQHLGGPSVATVAKGQKVKRGELIGGPSGFVSVGLHAPVEGTVTSLDLAINPSGQMQPAIRIKADPFSTQRFNGVKPIDWKTLDSPSFIKAVQSSGLVGLGGAAFPAHVKFSIPEGKKIDVLIINGCECEPFLTSDHRVMVEQSRLVYEGIRILNHFVGAEKVYIGIEANKPDAIEALAAESADHDHAVEVISLDVKYPQGAEKMLITAILDKEVPSGKLPIDVGTLVSNVSTVAALAEYFEHAQPLIERVITVTGTAVKRPANLMVPIGTPLRSVIDYCGGITSDAARILLGGPMMGIAQKSLDVPVTKGTSGIIILTDNEVRDVTTYKCIRCGHCIDACPLFLNPSLMGLLGRKGLYDEMEKHHVMDCFECASCSFVCPSGIPLTQTFRVAKSVLRGKKAKK